MTVTSGGLRNHSVRHSLHRFADELAMYLSTLQLRGLWSLLLLAAVLPICLGPRDVNAQDWARSLFKEYNHDFGNVARGSKVEHRFLIENRYEREVVIQSAVSSCGCTEVSLTRKRLGPGESAELIARFNTRAFTGFKQATVTVRFVAPALAEVQLNVRGNIRSDVTFEPGAVDFGQMSQNGNKQQTVRVSKLGNPNWQIVDVKSTYPHVRVQLSRPARNRNSVGYQMLVRLTEDVPAGFVNGELYVVTEERGRRVEIPLSFSGKVVSPLQISPEILTFSPSPGQAVKKKIIIKADEAFSITGVKSSDKSLRVIPTSEQKKIHFVEAIYTAPETPGEYEGEVIIETDLAGGTAGSLKTIVEVVDHPRP